MSYRDRNTLASWMMFFLLSCLLAQPALPLWPAVLILQVLRVVDDLREARKPQPPPYTRGWAP